MDDHSTQPLEGSIQSACLGRAMDFYWLGDAGRPVVLFPTSAGRHNENVDFGLTGALEEQISAGAIQVCSIDSINRDSWADDGLEPEEKLRRHEVYDRHLCQELVPYVTGRAGRDDLLVYGASLGAWQAATFASRHPELVARCVAFSGFFDLRQLVDGWWSDTCYFFSPVDFIPNMDEGWRERLRGVEWVIATGDGDMLADETRHFGGLLESCGIPALTEIWGDCFGHDWPWWKQNLPRFVS